MPYNHPGKQQCVACLRWVTDPSMCECQRTETPLWVIILLYSSIGLPILYAILHFFKIL